MPTPLVRHFGVEPDPAKRLRQRWGTEMRATRKLLGWTIDDLVERFTQAGYPITSQAVSSWERGETSPRPHHQIAWCKVTGRRHGEVFPFDEAA